MKKKIRRRYTKRGKMVLTWRDRLAYRIRMEHVAVGRSLRDSLLHARQAGQLLIEAKEKFARGSFMAWVKESCEFSHSKANAYMRIARGWDTLEANSQLVANSTIVGVDRWLRQQPELVTSTTTLTLLGKVVTRTVSPPFSPRPRHDWERKFYALEGRMARMAATLHELLPPMNRGEAEEMRGAALELRRAVDEKLIAVLDRHISGEIEQQEAAERERLTALAHEIGIMDDEPHFAHDEDEKVAAETNSQNAVD